MLTINFLVEGQGRCDDSFSIAKLVRSLSDLTELRKVNARLNQIISFSMQTDSMYLTNFVPDKFEVTYP